MTDELLDDDVPTAITGLGRRLLRRATVPGVIRPDLSARIQRRFSTGGGGLAAEIWHRWSPAAFPAWGHGSGWPHAGFGGWAGAVSGSTAALTSVPSTIRTPGRPGEGSEGRASSSPPISPSLPQQEAARRESDVIPPLSPIGPGVRSGEEPEVLVSRRRGSEAPVAPAGSQEGLGAGTPGASRLRLAHPRLSPVIRPKDSGTPATIGTGSVGLVQRKAATAMPSLPSGADVGPAIGRHAASPALAQPASALRFGADMGRAIYRRGSSARPTSSSMPPQISAAATARPLRSEAKPVPGITSHSADSAATQGASLPAESMPLPRIIAPAAAPSLRPEAEPAPAIAHHFANSVAMPQASLPLMAPGSPPPADLLLFAQHARTERTAPAVTAALPVAVFSPAAAATRNTLHWRASSTVPTVQTTMTSNLLQEASLPFAHPARVTERVIERDVLAETPPDTATDSAPPFPASLAGSVQDAARPAATEKLDLDDLAERVLSRMTRSLAVERERHGGQRWL